MTCGDYEWDTRDAWTQIETAYPYVIEFDATTRPVLHRKFTALREEMVCEVPFVHVDWFLAVASLPPLYHDILALPETESALERELGIDVAGNLQRAPGLRVMRAGTNDSGFLRTTASWNDTLSAMVRIGRAMTLRVVWVGRTSCRTRCLLIGMGVR